MDKTQLIDLLVKDFQDNEGKNRPAAESIKLRAMLEGFEISNLELLVSQINVV